MKNFIRFLIHFIILFFITFFVLFIYYLKIIKIEQSTIFYNIFNNIIILFPVITSLSLLWSIVTSKILQTTPASYSFSIFSYVLLTLILYFLLQEVVIVKLTEKNVFKKEKNKDKTRISETTLITNISYFSDNNIVNIKILKRTQNKYYGEGFKYFIFTNNIIKYIILSEKFYINNDKYILINPINLEFNNEKLIKRNQINGNKIIPLEHSIESIIDIENERNKKEISLIKIIKNLNYLTDSRINFYNFGNYLYNKISKYIIFTIMLILSIIFGFKYKLRKEISFEYFQLISFYIVSTIICLIIYDIIIQIFNFFYFISI